MTDASGFRLPHLHLPRPGVDLAKWAVVACDQYTSEPEYWQQVAAVVGAAPSTLQLIFPEVYLEQADAPARIERICAAMRRDLAAGVLAEHDGAVLVERRVDGRTRHGLMLELDLEHYDFSPDSTSLIRPTEGTIVARLAPRIAVRRNAELELPHVLVLIDDPEGTVIEPLVAARSALPLLYDTELMLHGGHLTGYAVDAARGAHAAAALAALGRPEVFARRHGVPESTPPMLFAVGDGNHSLATAKSIWSELRGRVGPDHPARWALVEVENIHDAGLHFAPIHRVLFGVQADVEAAARRGLGAGSAVQTLVDGDAMRERVAALHAAGHQAFGLVLPGPRFAAVQIATPLASLAVGSVQALVDRMLADGSAGNVDYVHGDDVLERLGQQAGCVGLHVPGLGKHELLNRVVREGPLPRKTFSMGEAHEKRFYMEARRIRPAQ